MSDFAESYPGCHAATKSMAVAAHMSCELSAGSTCSAATGLITCSKLQKGITRVPGHEEKHGFHKGL